MVIRSYLVALALGLTLGLTSTYVQAAETLTRYRGTVEARDTDTLTIKRREGGSVTVLMNVKTRLFIANTGRLRDIKPESYVSIVAVPGADGAPVPKLVAIYSPSERSFEAGTKPWDAGPGATFTAGWIGDLSVDVPRQVELVYQGGSKRFTIPPGTPTAQIAPGEKSLLVSGAEVVVFARTDDKGLVNADVVAVGRQGVVPTL